MIWQRIEKLSETAVQILCGQCIKEARILWSERPDYADRHLLHVTCHGEHKLVLVDEMHVRARLKMDAPLERLQLTWESLHEVGPEHLKEMREHTANSLKILHERLEHIDMVRGVKAGEVKG